MLYRKNLPAAGDGGISPDCLWLVWRVFAVPHAPGTCECAGRDRHRLHGLLPGLRGCRSQVRPATAAQRLGGQRTCMMHNESTSRLVESAREGDTAAIHALLVRFQADVTKFARIVCATPEDAEDAVQEALWDRRATYRYPTRGQCVYHLDLPGSQARVLSAPQASPSRGADPSDSSATFVDAHVENDMDDMDDRV